MADSVCSPGNKSTLKPRVFVWFHRNTATQFGPPSNDQEKVHQPRFARVAPGQASTYRNDTEMNPKVNQDRKGPSAKC